MADAITQLLERAPHSGFVVGLDGAWGEGKSSVMAMTAHRLEQRGSAQVICFNPWLFSSADELVSRFFATLASNVEIQGCAGRRAAKSLSRLGGALNKLGAVPGAVGDAFEIGGTLASGAGDLLEAGRTLEEQRKRVKAGLQALARPIVVMIDDADRLRSANEIAELMRLIRSVGDLPRVTYLVSYERGVVSRALGDGDVRQGLKYLEKIVQATFELPPVRRDLLEGLLTAAIEQVLATVPAAQFDTRRFDLVRYHGFDLLFKNVRDVRRFTAAITAKLAQVHSEVDVVDVLVLEALRLADPTTFSQLMADSTLLTSPGLRSLTRDTSVADREARAAIYAAAQLPQTTERLIEQLFPATDQHSGASSNSMQRRWRRQRRVAHPDILLAYLQLGLPVGAVSAEDVSRARDALNEPRRLEHLLRSNDSRRLASLLTQLDDDDDPFVVSDRQTAVQLLVDAAAEHRAPDPFEISDGAHLAITRLIIRLLKAVEPPDAEQVVAGLVWPDLSTREDILTDLGWRDGYGHKVLSEEAATRFEVALVADILDAPAELLAEEHGIGRLMWLAHDVDPQQARRRMPQLIKNHLFLVRWLFNATILIRGDGVRHLLPWPRLADRVDADVLTAALDALPEDWVREHADEQQQEVLAQAKFYSRNPEQAKADLAPYDTD